MLGPIVICGIFLEAFALTEQTHPSAVGVFGGGVEAAFLAAGEDAGGGFKVDITEGVEGAEALGQMRGLGGAGVLEHEVEAE